MADKKPATAETSVGTPRQAVKLPSLQVGQASMYVLEYFLVLLHVGLGLGLVSALFNQVLQFWAGEKFSGVLSAFAYDVTIGMVAAVVIVFSLLGVLFTRIRTAKPASESAAESRWRAVWLNLFLAAVFVWGLSALIGVAHELIDALLNADFDDGHQLWVSVAGYVFNLVLAAGAWDFFYEGKHSSNEQRDRMFLVSFTGLAIVLLILTVAFPLAEQRSRRIDSFIEKDLGVVASAVEDYVATESKLPRELDDLDLADDVKNRATKYVYEYSRTSASSFSVEYELCAVFKSDTTSLKKQDQGLGLLDAVRGTVPVGFGQHDLSSHTAGRDCFELTASGLNPFSGRLQDAIDGSEGSSTSPAIQSLFETIQ